jgi:hypothetical protein
MKFRVMAGQHIQDGPDGKNHVYKTNDVVESKKDLVAQFGREKFQREHDDAPVQAAAPLAQPEKKQRGAAPAG